MAYIKKEMRFKNAREVMEYHTGRYGAPGQGRVKRKKATPEQIEKVNQVNKERLCRWRLRQHFGVNDYLSTLTYKKEERPPDMEAAKRDFQKFIRKLRLEYEKRGEKLRWIRNIEVGTKGGWHIHIVLNRISDTDILLKKMWKKGKVVNQLLYEKGEFAELAAYMTKTPKTDSRLKETSYSTSKNLPLPEPDKKIYRHWKTWKDIEKVRIPDGFYMDRDTYVEGINPLTGYKYRRYTILRIRRE